MLTWLVMHVIVLEEERMLTLLVHACNNVREETYADVACICI